MSILDLGGRCVKMHALANHFDDMDEWSICSLPAGAGSAHGSKHLLAVDCWQAVSRGERLPDSGARNFEGGAPCHAIGPDGSPPAGDLAGGNLDRQLVPYG